MLWEHEPQASVPTAFESVPKLTLVFLELEKTRRTCFLYLLESIATKKGKSTCLI